MFGVLLPAFGYFPAIDQIDVGLNVFGRLFDHPAIWASSLLSLRVGVTATLLSVIVAVCMTTYLSGTRVWKALTGLLGPLLALPHAAAAFGIAFLYAPSGLILRLFSPWLTGFERPPDWLIIQDPMGWSMVVGLVIKEVPFLVLLTVAAAPLVRVERRLAVGASLGYAGPAAIFLTVWPALYPQIRLGIYLVLAYSISVVDVAQIVGPTTPPPLAVLVTRWMNDPDLSLKMLGAAGAVWQLCLVLVGVAVYRGIEAVCGATYRLIIARGLRLPMLNRGKPVGFLFAAIMLGTLLGGVAVLGLWSFAGFWGFPDAFPDALTWRNWSRHSGDLQEASKSTLILAFGAAIVSAILAIWMFETGPSLPKWLLYAPLVVPQITFLPGIQILALELGLDQGMVPVFLAHLLFVIPYFVLTISGPYLAWDRRYAQASATLAVGPQKTLLLVKLPMLLASILAALAISVAVSVSQYLPTLLIGGGRVQTLTTEAVALASGGDRRAIGVFGVAQIGAAVLPYVLALVLPVIVWRNRKGMNGA